jgi:MGT family glycosyltransferase
LSESLRQSLWKRAYQRIWNRDGLPAINQARTQLGLRPLSCPFDQYARADCVLVLGSRAFDITTTNVPVNVRYVGTPIDDLNPVEGWKAPWPSSNKKPFVLVSLSSLPQGQAPVMHRILEALGGMDVQALVTLGPLKAEDFSPPANVTFEGFVPHGAVLTRVDAMVTQAGLGGVTKALVHGVPLICIPIVGDQPDNAARVAAHGAGIALEAKAAAPEIRKALHRVLTDPSFRAAAQALGSEIGAEKAEENAANELERLAAT